MTPSNANTSGLEYYGFRAFNAGIGVCHLVANPGLNDTNPEPLVTAASAQARIAELEAVLAVVSADKGILLDCAARNADRATAAEARADRLAKALRAARPYVADLPIVGDADLAIIDAALQQEG